MIVFLRDWHFRVATDPHFRTTWRDHLEQVFPLDHEKAVSSDLLLKERQPDSLLKDDSIVFLHANSTQTDWINWFCDTSSGPKGHLVVISTEMRVTREPDWPDRVHGCYWLPEDFSQASDNESVRQFIADLDKGIFRQDLLQPQSFPDAILAFCLAVHYGLPVDNLADLRKSADRAYAEILPFARSVARRKAGRDQEDQEKLLPDFETFGLDSSTEDDATSTRFRSMRNLIDALRIDD